MNPQYNWQGVLDFLQTQYHKTLFKQSDWALERRQFNDRIAQLQAQLKAAEDANAILVKRNRMLQIALKQQKGSNAGDFRKEQLLPIIPQRKPKNNREILQKILENIGIKDLLPEDLLQPPSQLQLNIKQKDNASDLFRKSTTFKGHTDNVKDLSVLTKKQVLVSVSDDRLIKLWDLKKQLREQQCVPLATIRDYYGPVFTVTAANSEDEFDNLFFTAGVEGFIKAYQLLDNLQDTKKMLICNFNHQDKNDTVWQLLYAKTQCQLYCASADGSIRNFQLTPKASAGRLIDLSHKLKCTYNFRGQGDEQDVPTAICLVPGRQHQLAAGYMHSNSLIIYDRETRRIVSKLQLESQWSANFNKIIQFNNTLLSAHQDRFIRIYDPLSITLLIDKHVQAIEAHDDSVSAVTLSGKDVVSGSQDGTLKLWSPKKWQSLQTWTSHSRKYNQSVHGVFGWQNKLASCGADSLINIFVR